LLTQDSIYGDHYPERHKLHKQIPKVPEVPKPFILVFMVVSEHNRQFLPQNLLELKRARGRLGLFSNTNEPLTIYRDFLLSSMEVRKILVFVPYTLIGRTSGCP
jgi:hypothetical protein